MNVRTIIFFLFCLAMNSVFAGNAPVKILPQYPQRGQEVTIQFDPAAEGSVLKNPEQVTLVFTYSNIYEVAWKLEMERKGNIWETSFVLPRYATYATFYLQSGEKVQQPAPKKHYELAVYTPGRERVENGYLYESYSLTAQIGKAPDLITRQNQLLRKELEVYPSNYEAKLRLLNNQMSTTSGAEKEKLRQQAHKVIAEKFYSAPGVMGTLNKVTMGYLIIGENSRLDSIRQVVREKYPLSEGGIELIASDIRQLEPEKRKQAAEAWLEKHGAKDLAGADAYHRILLDYYAEKRNPEKVIYHHAMLPADTSPNKGENWKEYAELLLENDLLLDTALAYAQRALQTEFPAGLIRFFPETGHIPSYVDPETKKRKQAEARAKVLTLMGLIAQKKGEKKQAEDWVQQGIQLAEDPETLENAYRFYATAGSHQKAYTQAKKLVLKVPEDTTALFNARKSYAAWKGSMNGWPEEEAEMNDIWITEMTSVLQKERISMPLPVLNPLLDMKGNPVPASHTKGKIVVIDFWATWCVPCMKEMPYLQSLYEKYKDHPDVEFMILNSGSKNTLEDAQNWWGNKQYSFPVFYTSDKQVAEKFGFNVIPATYVVNKEGVIQFKTIGFEGAMIGKKLDAAIQLLLAE